VVATATGAITGSSRTSLEVLRPVLELDPDEDSSGVTWASQGALNTYGDRGREYLPPHFSNCCCALAGGPGGPIDFSALSSARTAS